MVKLYSEERLFLCRHCYGLFHFSKNEGFWDRSLRQRDKHRVRLSGDANLEAFETLKPKGMWWRTYYRLQRRAQAAEWRIDEGFLMVARTVSEDGVSGSPRQSGPLLVLCFAQYPQSYHSHTPDFSCAIASVLS